MKCIGVIPNKLKDVDLKITDLIAGWFNERGCTIYAPHDIKENLSSTVVGVSESELYEICDSLIAIGGDGTILGVAEKASQREIPIVGVNLGRLGFLADIEPRELETLLQKFFDEDYEIEERMMLKATIVSGEGEEEIFYALNDINVTRANFARLVEFEIKVNDELCDIYPADGIIIASPTGSTAYNLSAGGPIITPHANTYVITPICPHTIYAKSIMVSDKDKVKIKTFEEGNEMALSIDGRLEMYLTPSDSVYVEKADKVTKLIKLSKRNFFDILREKMVERRR